MNKLPDNINTICFCGAAIVGLSCLGVMDYIESHNIININNIHTFAGTSSGSMLALYYALKYTTKEIIDIINHINLNYIFNLNLSNILKIIKLNDINDSNNLIIFINTLIYNKYNKYDITFQELYNLTNKNLIVIGCNQTLNKEEVFSYDYTPNMSIIMAVRISLAHPILFTPILYNSNYYIDGGIKNYFPYNYCNPKKTLGIYIKIIDNINIYHKIINTIFYSNQKKQYYTNVITIEFTDVNRFDFSKDYVNNIINYGRKYTKNYFTFKSLKINSTNNNTNYIIIIIILLIIFILYNNYN